MLGRSMLMATLVACVSVASTAAPAFPDRPVTIIVPFAAGGGVDVLVRALGASLSARWKQPVIIDNRTGAGSLIGSEAVARSKPDGYTLLATTSQTFTANRFLYKTLPYDPDKSFVPITMLVKADQFIVANPNVRAVDLKELVALARDRGNGVVYGSWGVGSEPQITFEQLNSHEHIDMTHVPYKGVAPVLQALAGSEISVSVASAAVASPLLLAGKIRTLAIAGPSRSLQFPAVPTTAEQGFPYLRAAILIGLFAPADTPAPVLQKIGADVRELLKDPTFARQQVSDRGFDVVASEPEQVRTALREETARIAEVVQAIGIKPE